ncbi:MAG: carbohydate-binding domain-containing protein, partial [Cyclobacteriaceae bacterium]|nr:carbohydate-binding domain-containing protein [Cyclobacteriaceae bacterium]
MRKYLLYLGTLLMLITSCKQDVNTANVEFGKDLNVSWELITNFSDEGDGIFEAHFLLENKGTTEIKAGDWKLFFSMAPRKILSEKTTGNAIFKHRNGDLFYVEPLEGFSIPAGETLEVKYYGNGPVIKVSDAPIGIYIAGGENELNTVAINNYTILPFTRPEQINRFGDDKEPIPDAGYYFAQNKGTEFISTEKLAPFTPVPNTYSYGEVINIETGFNITEGGVLSNEIGFLKEELAKMSISVVGGIPVEIAVKEGLKEEGYELNISSDMVIINGGDPTGVFYGVQSFIAYLSNCKNANIPVRALQVEDAPAFGYRGMHLDVARNFQTKETVLKFIDFMSAYKMNTIEIYLSEDEGWRIEIAALPELTQVGSQRGHSADESEFIQPAYGSGAEPGKLYGSGFYTRADYVEILRYATKRHVKVIPTINVPGHSRAAIKAMQNRYERLMAEGDEEGALEYYLHDPNDKSVYSGAQSFNDNILCVCKESTVKFFVTVLDEIIDMYKEAEAPLEMFHSGGDEVPAGSWEKSPLCEELMKTTPEIKNARNWQAYYFKKIVKEIKDRGLLVGGWEE